MAVSTVTYPTFARSLSELSHLISGLQVLSFRFFGIFTCALCAKRYTKFPKHNEKDKILITKERIYRNLKETFASYVSLCIRKVSDVSIEDSVVCIVSYFIPGSKVSGRDQVGKRWRKQFQRIIRRARSTFLSIRDGFIHSSGEMRGRLSDKSPAARSSVTFNALVSRLIIQMSISALSKRTLTATLEIMRSSASNRPFVCHNFCSLGSLRTPLVRANIPYVRMHRKRH